MNELEKFKDIIEKNPMAFASIDSLNKPNVIGVAYVKVVSSNQILVTDNYMKHTVENIKNNPAICLAVWDTNWKGCKLIGQAEYFNEGKWKEFIDKMPENKGLPAKGAILITVENVIELK